MQEGTEGRRRCPRLGRDRLETGSIFPSGQHGISKAQITTQRSHWTATYPWGCSDGWPLARQALMSPGGPKLGSCIPQYDLGLSFLLFLASLLGFHVLCRWAAPECCHCGEMKHSRENRVGSAMPAVALTPVGFNGHKVASNSTDGHFGQLY